MIRAVVTADGVRRVVRPRYLYGVRYSIDGRTWRIVGPLIRSRAATIRTRLVVRRHVHIVRVFLWPRCAA
jgi:hypothetical protein